MEAVAVAMVVMVTTVVPAVTAMVVAATVVTTVVLAVMAMMTTGPPRVDSLTDEGSDRTPRSTHSHEGRTGKGSDVCQNVRMPECQNVRI